MNYKDILQVDGAYSVAQKIIKFHILQRLNEEILESEGFESPSSTVPKLTRIIKYNDTTFYDYVGEFIVDKIR